MFIKLSNQTQHKFRAWKSYQLLKVSMSSIITKHLLGVKLWEDRSWSWFSAGIVLLLLQSHCFVFGWFLADPKSRCVRWWVGAGGLWSALVSDSKKLLKSESWVQIQVFTQVS